VSALLECFDCYSAISYMQSNLPYILYWLFMFSLLFVHTVHSWPSGNTCNAVMHDFEQQKFKKSGPFHHHSNGWYMQG